MKMQASLKFILFLMGLQIFIASAFIAVAVVDSAVPATSGFWLGFESSLAHQAGAENIAQVDPRKWAN